MRDTQINAVLEVRSAVGRGTGRAGGVVMFKRMARKQCTSIKE